MEAAPRNMVRRPNAEVSLSRPSRSTSTMLAGGTMTRVRRLTMTRVRGGITKDNTDGDVNIDSRLKTNKSAKI